MGYTPVHALQPKEIKKIIPVNKVVFDIETINWTEPYSVGFYDGINQTHTFDGQDCLHQFIQFFLTHRWRNRIAYAHNGGKFDFSFILDELIKKEYNKKFVITPMRTAGRIIQIEISTMTMKKGKKVKNHTWTLRDSIALLPRSLKDLSNNFDVEHKKGEFHHASINWNNWSRLMPEWKPYLIDDCRSLFEVLTKFETFVCNNWGVTLRKNLTLAQLSMDIYKSNFLKINIPNYQSSEDDIRQSYFGGRTEIFNMYGTDLKYYDVNSLYPDVMKENYMPVGQPMKSYCMTLNDFGVAYAEVECPLDLDIPLLPYRVTGKEKKLIFPTGKWKGWYCTPELQKAKQLGYKIKVLHGYKFKQAKIFDGFIDSLYEIKLGAEKGGVAYIISKLIMNSLYGKFGQKRDRETLIMFPESEIGLEPVDFFGDLPIFIKKTESQAKHILPAIASFVTCHARLKLYSIMEKVVQKGGKVYYTDTDSVVTDVELETGGELGELSDEVGQPIKEGIFLLPKMYSMELEDGEVIRCKGFPKQVECECSGITVCQLCSGKGKLNLFNFKMFKDAYLTGDYSKLKFAKRRMATPFESMRRNKKFVSMINFSRRVVNKYDKRIVLEGGATAPRMV